MLTKLQLQNLYQSVDNMFFSININYSKGLFINDVIT